MRSTGSDPEKHPKISTCPCLRAVDLLLPVRHSPPLLYSSARETAAGCRWRMPSTRPRGRRCLPSSPSTWSQHWSSVSSVSPASLLAFFSGLTSVSPALCQMVMACVPPFCSLLCFCFRRPFFCRSCLLARPTRSSLLVGRVLPVPPQTDTPPLLPSSSLAFPPLSTILLGLPAFCSLWLAGYSNKWVRPIRPPHSLEAGETPPPPQPTR